MNEYLLGQLVGASIPPAAIAFIVTRKATHPVVPYLAALGGALAGIGGLTAFNAVTRPLVTAKSGIREDEQRFIRGCERSCAAARASEDQCRALCGCVLGKLRARYPSDEQLASWIHESAGNPELAKKDAVELGSACAQETRSTGSTP